MGAIVGLETVTCRNCHATYLATFKIDRASAGSLTCAICGQVLITWDGERSYSDFRLVHRRCS